MCVCVVFPIIANINTSFELNSKIDFEILKNKVSCYQVKKKFFAMIYKIASPKATLNIYESGKIVMSGLKEIEDCEIAAKKFADILSEPNKLISVCKLCITNMVYSGFFGRNVNLIDFVNEINRAYKHGGDLSASYEPELFSGVRCSKRSTKQRITIFRNGRFFITGVKNEEHAIDIFRLTKSFVEFVCNFEVINKTL